MLNERSTRVVFFTLQKGDGQMAVTFLHYSSLTSIAAAIQK
jgi:hypothetical protein